MPAPNKQLTTAFQSLITGAAGGSAVVLVSFANTTGGPVTVDVNVVPDGGAAQTDNQLFGGPLSIPAGDTYFFNEKLLLAVGESVQTKASAITSITTITSYLDL